MARAYSHDLRVRVLDAVGAGLSRRKAAARYRIGIAPVIRWAAQVARTGETQAKRQGRPRGSKLDAHEGFLLALIEERDDLTLAEMQDRLRGVSVGLGTLWRFFDGRAITWKKDGARRRAGPPRRGGRARSLVRGSARSRSRPPDLWRRDRSLHPHGPPARAVRPRSAPALRDPAWPLEGDDLCGRPAAVGLGRADGAGRADDARLVPGLRRTGARPDADAGRHCHPRQPARPQGVSDPGCS